MLLFRRVQPRPAAGVEGGEQHGAAGGGGLGGGGLDRAEAADLERQRGQLEREPRVAA